MCNSDVIVPAAALTDARDEATAMPMRGPDDHLQGAPARLPARHDERLATHTEDSSGCYSIEPSCQQGVSDPVSPLDGYPERAGDQEKKTPRALKTQKLAHSEATGRTLVLAVDDSEVNLGAVRRMLTPLGYDVKTATSGEATLASLQSEPTLPDVLIVDTVMPGGMSGYELCSRVRESWDRAQLPVLLLASGCEAEEAPSQSALVEADDVLVKPVRTQELASRVSIQLYTRELMRQMALMSLFTEQADQQQAQKEAEEKDEVDGRSAAVAAPAAASTCATAGSTLHEADCPAPQCHGHMIKV